MSVSDDDDAAGVVRLWVLPVPCQRFRDSRVRAEARVRAQDQEVREEGAEEAVEAAQVLEEVGEGRRRRVHEPQDAAQVPEVVRPLRLIAAPLAFQTKRGAPDRER